ncbi:exosortase A [Kordiimonas lipolytica]|uniref:Exosortase A n=1 Tax=Kordiimonas lipolytica TaxID=1662421 RepID=A0ABV8UEN4_9PROT|nr:exosortase A [Kordiimonas lipolytica]
MAAEVRKNLAVLGAGLLLLVVAWFDTLRHLATLVWTVDIFSHGIWVPLVSLWLIWRERSRLDKVPVSFWWPGAVGLMFVASLWLLGGAAEAKIVQHLAFVGAIQFLVLATLGPQLYRGILFPMLFLFAIVPFGSALVAPLQVFTAKIVIWALKLTGIGHQADGVLIQLSSGIFEVAAACAGVKFLFSSLITGILLCRLAFKSWRRRVLMLVASIIVPIIANAVRVYGTLLIAEATDSSFAKDVDHIVYGWGFLSAVLIILIAAAYRFSDLNDEIERADTRIEARGESEQSELFGLIAVVLSLLAVLSSGLWLPAGGQAKLSCLPDMQVVSCEDCGVRQLAVGHQPNWIDIPKADVSSPWLYRLEADTVFGVSAFFLPDRAGHRLASPVAVTFEKGWSLFYGQGLSSQAIGRAVFEETALYGDGRKRLVWRTYYVGGRFYGSALKAKLALALQRLQGRPVIGQMLVAATEFPSTPEHARAILSKFFSTLTPERFLFSVDPTGREKTLCVASPE